ncbi:MAG: NAD-dependent epimerase/dehydratase family protein [Phenylobacterium sp.]|uniref:NAD-dependent epimerase/dehydratase family protein n=1 Tax=Phenylobacterium sp. TaxID=1871053 RepID=UPI001A5B7DAB|nr:NAD-dependent epimerase/dehydratase family protein [Phenylobacterium sp.]MBL8772370.1 NAD-dependent epimerase/dehydratase family protein [Phenylobacterium sp.]
MKTVLVAGATGLVGEAAVARFAAAGWNVIAVSRRTPEPTVAASVRHIAVDLTDPAACRAALGGLGEVTHLVYAALYEKPGLLAGWRETDQMETNLSMLRNLLEPLAAARPLRHVTLLQGTKAYGAHLRARIPIPARERAPRDDHANFYWLQEDYLRATAGTRGFDWTIFRPQIVVGAAWGAAMNPLLPLAVYAAIRRELGQPFAYTGGAPQVMELVDPRLLGEAFAWAAEAPAAAGETFNITNGDVFAWSEVWPAMAEAFGMAQGPDEPLRLAEWLPAHAEIWDRIVAREGLRPIPLDRLLGESHHYVDALTRPGVTAVTLPILVSTIKLRQAGFGACYDTEDTLRFWIAEMARRKLIPTP